MSKKELQDPIEDKKRTVASNKELEKEIARITAEKEEHDQLLAGIDSTLEQYEEFDGRRVSNEEMVFINLPEAAKYINPDNLGGLGAPEYEPSDSV